MSCSPWCCTILKTCNYVQIDKIMLHRNLDSDLTCSLLRVWARRSSKFRPVSFSCRLRKFSISSSCVLVILVLIKFLEYGFPLPVSLRRRFTFFFIFFITSFFLGLLVSNVSILMFVNAVDIRGTYDITGWTIGLE